MRYLRCIQHPHGFCGALQLALTDYDSCRVKRLLLCVCIMLTVVSIRPSFALDSTRALEFGVIPQQTTERLIKDWKPVMDFLRKELKRPVRFATAPSISEFVMRCKEGRYDIAYMNPYLYTQVSSKPGYQVVANQSHKKLYGIIVVPRGSSITRLEDLNNMTLDLPSPHAFASSLLVQSELRKRNIQFETHFSGSHDSVYRNVVYKIAHAGGGILRTLHAQPANIQNQLRVLAKTRAYTPHAIAVHPRVSKKLTKRIATALSRIPKPTLEVLGFNRLQPARDKDYDDVRDLDLPLSITALH